MGVRGVVALIAVSLSGATACGTPHQRGGADWLTEHATPAAATAPAPVDAKTAHARFDAAIAAGDDPLAIVVAAGGVIRTGGELGAGARARVLGAVDQLRGDALARAWKQLAADRFPAPAVALRLALVARHTGDLRGALPWLDKAAADPSLAARAGELRAAIDARLRVEPARIAVVLPLSGRYRRLGSELRDAIELAARRAGDVNLRFLDTAGDAARASAAVDRAVRELHVAAVLGPVGAQESEAAAARAAELGVPIALLSPAQYGAAPDVGVFRLWSPPTWEAREAVRVAVAMGYDHLAVLAPRDEQGGAQIDAFRAAARGAGVQVVASGQYDPTATDLQPDIKAFLGLDPRTNPRLARYLRRHGVKKGWKTFTPDVPFDLLFLPDDYQRASLVAAFLPYFNVELRTEDVIDIPYLQRKHGGRVPQVVQLLGSSGWHHPGLIPRGGQLLERAMFLDVWAGEDEGFATEGAAEFSRAFQQKTGREPGAVAAQAYDAATLLFAARRRAAGRGGDLRAGVAAALRSARLDDGACGPAAVGPSGEIEREAVVLRVDGGQFTVVER